MKRPVVTRVRSLLMLAGIGCLAMPDQSRACNVPVFRYAMERWSADAYRVVVYQGPGARPAALDMLRKGASGKDSAGNYSLEVLDVTTPEGKTAAERRAIVEFPWVEVYYPVQSRFRSPISSGRLTSDYVRKILRSPGRTRLAEKLLGGDVAVWVLVRSGRNQHDRRARESLRTSLERASATLRIQETGADADGDLVEVTDFKAYPVRFSLMEVDRDDPEEELLVKALLMSEPDLEAYDEPLAFPVFGRGRALYALVGGGIQEKNIREACASMLAWCSCEIKAQNPGTDLPVAADWTRPFGGRMVKDPDVPLTGVSGFLGDRKARTVAAPRPPEPAETPALCKLTPPERGARPPERVPERPGSMLMRNMLTLAGGAGLALVALSILLAVRTRK